MTLTAETTTTQPQPARFNVHQHITDLIVTAIEQGGNDWQMPWHRSAHAITRPRNVVTGNA